jgi:hypothetical protein
MDIVINKTVLVAGNIIIEETRSVTPMAMRTQSVAPLKENYNPIEEIPFAELLTFPVEKQLSIGEKYSLPLHKYKIKAHKIYQFDVSRYNNLNSKFTEAEHGYIITVTDELPAGLVKIYAKSSSLKTNLLFGSVRINRTPKKTPVEVIIGKTSRLRATLNRTDSSTNIENGVIKREKYTVADIQIIGEITNDTKENQDVVVKDWANGNIVKSSPKPDIFAGYLEWHYIIKPGKTMINISYQIRF